MILDIIMKWFASMTMSGRHQIMLQIAKARPQQRGGAKLNEEHIKFLVNLLDVEKLKHIVTDIDLSTITARGLEQLHWRIKQLAIGHKMKWWSMKDTIDVLEFLKTGEA